MNDKPFELTLRLRNNILKRFRTDLGLTMKEMAEQIGMSYGLYTRCEGLFWCPVGQDAGRARWKPTATKIASFFGVLPEDIWPPEVLRVINPVLVREMSAEELHPMLESQHHGVSIAMLEAPPEEMIARREVAYRLAEYLQDLPPAKALVVRERAMSRRQFSEIGEMLFDRMGIRWGREMIRQVYGEAIQEVRERCMADKGMMDLLGRSEHG